MLFGFIFFLSISSSTSKFPGVRKSTPSTSFFNVVSHSIVLLSDFFILSLDSGLSFLVIKTLV